MQSPHQPKLNCAHFYMPEHGQVAEHGNIAEHYPHDDDDDDDRFYNALIPGPSLS